MMKMPKEIRILYEVIPVGARYKQLGRPTHFRNGHQNPINGASLMVMVVVEIWYISDNVLLFLHFLFVVKICKAHAEWSG